MTATSFYHFHPTISILRVGALCRRLQISLDRPSHRHAPKCRSCWMTRQRRDLSALYPGHGRVTDIFATKQAVVLSLCALERARIIAWGVRACQEAMMLQLATRSSTAPSSPPKALDTANALLHRSNVASSEIVFYQVNKPDSGLYAIKCKDNVEDQAVRPSLPWLNCALGSMQASSARHREYIIPSNHDLSFFSSHSSLYSGERPHLGSPEIPRSHYQP